MKEKKLLTGIIVLLLCVLIAAAASAELKAVSKEENGKIRETVWLDENGQPAAGPEGYATVRYSYKMDNIIEQYFDTEGRPYLADGGYYGKRVQKDGKGKITEIEYLDADGQRMLNKAGYALTGITYYGFGEARTITYYGLNKKPVIVPSLGYASVYTEYSNTTMTRRTYRDEKGNPVDNTDGYAVLNQKVNKRFIVLSIRYDHADGSHATGPDGWWRCVKDRDDKGRLLSVKYYDESEKLTDRGAGYAWEGYEYPDDSTVRITLYDMNDEPTADSAGVVTTEREMKDSRIIRERYLDKEKNRICNEIGIGEILYSYDQQGSLEKVSYLDTEGNPALCTKGYAGYRDTKDNDGSTVSRTFLGTDGMPVEIPAGYSEIRYFYDDMKQLSSVRYYDLNGKQIQGE